MKAHPNPGNDPDALDSLRNRHLDEVWELEMAEEAHERAHHDDAVPAVGRLRHYLTALRHHYGQRTPHDLPMNTLAADAHYLRHRYDRIGARVRRMIEPDGVRHDLAHACAHHNTVLRVHFKSACDVHAEFLKEVRESIRYWEWAREHHRLPRRLALYLGPFNLRPIAHPWTNIPAPVMATLAQLEIEMHHYAIRMAGGEPH